MPATLVGGRLIEEEGVSVVVILHERRPGTTGKTLARERERCFEGEEIMRES